MKPLDLTHATRVLVLASAMLALGCSSSSDDDAGGGAGDVVNDATSQDDDVGAGGTGEPEGTGGTGDTEDAGGAGVTGDTGGTAVSGDTGDAGGTGAGAGPDAEVIVSTPDALTGEVSRYGIVSIEQPGNNGAREGNVSGSFFSSTLVAPAGDVAAAYRPPLDTCTVSRSSTDTLGGLPDLDFDFNTISAGESLVFTNPGGTWLTLPRQTQSGFVLYRLVEDETLPTPVPNGLVVDIPGDEFPAFANVSIPDVAPLTGVDFGGAVVTVDTVFRWDPVAGDVPITISSTAIDFSTFDVTSLECIAADDGEFTLPAATRAELGPDFNGSGATLSRTDARFLRRGNALLIVSNSSSSN